MTDPIADMLTRIRNALMIKHHEILLPYSKAKFKLAELLKNQGYISDTKKIEGDSRSILKITLKYHDGKPAIKSLKRISVPGRRIYKSKDKLPWVLQGMGIAVVSTSKGLMTDKEARKNNLGGEILCEVW